MMMSGGGIPVYDTELLLIAVNSCTSIDRTQKMSIQPFIIGKLDEVRRTPRTHSPHVNTHANPSGEFTDNFSTPGRRECKAPSDESVYGKISTKSFQSHQSKLSFCEPP